MKTLTIKSGSNNTETLKKIASKKRFIRKSAKAVTRKGAAYAAYVRDHEKAYRTLAAIENDTLNSVRSNVKKILAAQKP